MGATQEQIVHDLMAARNALDQDLSAFESWLKAQSNWRLQARRHPMVAVSIAVAAALLLGLLLGKVVRGGPRRTAASYVSM
jgi:hypothetical protein